MTLHNANQAPVRVAVEFRKPRGYYKHYVVNIPGSTPARAWLTRGGWGARVQAAAGEAASRRGMSGAVREARGGGGRLQEGPGAVQEDRGPGAPD